MRGESKSPKPSPICTPLESCDGSDAACTGEDAYALDGVVASRFTLGTFLGDHQELWGGLDR
jgi:hypothetical protein